MVRVKGNNGAPEIAESDQTTEEETMMKMNKNRTLAAAAAVTLLAGLAIPAYAAISGDYVGEAKAKAAALEHAGVTEKETSYLRVELERDDGRVVYDVEFYAGNREYDYEISATTGSILKFDYDIENFTRLASGQGTQSTAQSGTDIGAEKAKSIALENAGLTASQVSFVYAQPDWDDGRREYEVVFYANSREYDYTIDAATGAILSYDYDIDWYNAAASRQSSTDIGAEKAKSIALEHAGISAADADYLYAQLDRDDGLRIYDVEFFSGSREYDYEIDAATGTILSFDYDAERSFASSSTGSTASASGSYLSEARIKEIVEEAAGTTGTFYELKMDRDDGRVVYEGTMRSGWTEYEFEVDASTGRILDWDVDRD